MHSWILLSLAVLGALSATSGGPLKCTKPMDVLFLLDKSASIKDDQWKIQKEFVRKLIGRFEVGASQMQASVTLFAKKARPAFCFNKHTTAAALDKAVAGLNCPKCKKGKTGTGAGLEYGRTKSLTAKCGARENAAKVVVVLTDGRSTEKGNYLKNQAELMKAHVGHVIAIGVGKDKKIDVAELELIASSKDLVFTTNSFDKLLAIGDKIADAICEVVKPVPETPTLVHPATSSVEKGTPVTLTCMTKSKLLSTFTFYRDGEPIQTGPSSDLVIAAASGDDVGTYSCSLTHNHVGEPSAESNSHKLSVMGVCDAPLDLLLLVDKSASIKNFQWKLSKQFLGNLVDSFHVSPDVVRVSLVVFAIGSHEKFCFNEHISRAQVKEAVTTVTCPECRKGKTGTGSALRHGREKSFTEDCGAREGVKKVVVVMTDGGSTEKQEYFETQAKLMKETGAHVIAVGVGEAMNKPHTKAELELIASDKASVFHAGDFNKLQGMLETISKKTCVL